MKFFVVFALAGLAAAQYGKAPPTRPPPRSPKSPYSPKPATAGPSRPPPAQDSDPNKTTPGPSISWGPTKNEILRVETVFTPGKIAHKQEGRLYSWTSLYNAMIPKSDVITTVADSDGISSNLCNAPPGHWCLQPEVGQPSKDGARSGKPVAIAPDAQIRIEYLKTNDSANWIQRTIDQKTGVQLHNYVHGKGKMTGWSTGMQMVGRRGTVGTQYYQDTIITLAAPDPAFGGSIQPTGGATYTGVRNQDNGRMWKIDRITIPPTRHNNLQTL